MGSRICRRAEPAGFIFRPPRGGVVSNPVSRGVVQADVVSVTIDHILMILDDFGSLCP